MVEANLADLIEVGVTVRNEELALAQQKLTLVGGRKRPGD